MVDKGGTAVDGVLITSDGQELRCTVNPSDAHSPDGNGHWRGSAMILGDFHTGMGALESAGRAVIRLDDNQEAEVVISNSDPATGMVSFTVTGDFRPR
jgi:hypothetical protein